MMIALDRDPTAIAAGQVLVAAHGGHLKLIHSQFSLLVDHAPDGGLDGVVLDIGASSCRSIRRSGGFRSRRVGRSTCAWRQAGLPPPIRQSRQGRRPHPDLRLLGEEHRAPRIADAIDSGAPKTPSRTTRDLARPDRACGSAAQDEGQDPSGNAGLPGAAHFRQRRARRAGEALVAGERALKPGGRLVVVTFIRWKTASSSSSSPTVPARFPAPAICPKRMRRCSTFELGGK